MKTDDPLLFPEALVGWRSWDLKHGRLRSLTQSEEWPVGEELMARCGMNAHRCPNLNCVCGIYAKNTLAKLKSSSYMGSIFGQVSLWGRVLEAEDGFRAEFAYPKIIYVTYLNYKLVEPLSVYGVPVTVMNPYRRKATWRSANRNA
jgi:hypothetical protein